MKYIIEFQKKYGLTPDGIIGKATLTKMKSLWGLSNAQLAHMLANVDNETGGFTVAIENLNYSAARLAKIWPKRYMETIDVKNNASKVIKHINRPNALAYQIANNPQAIANKTYANRYGNGNEASGDGYKYRGAGGIQITFHDNYKAFSKHIKDAGVMQGAEYVAKYYFWEATIFYFTYAKLWTQMRYTDADAVRQVRKAVNGGYIGLEEVQEKFTYYLNLLNK